MVLAGCGHAGIINTLRHAMAKQIAPALIVPSHCTGWKATHEIARALPDAFVPNSVGTPVLI